MKVKTKVKSGRRPSVKFPEGPIGRINPKGIPCPWPL